MAHNLRHSLFFCLSSLARSLLIFLFFRWIFPPFELRRPGRTRTQLSWALVFDSKGKFSCNFSWVAVLSGSRVEPRRAQMNGHYVYPKWKRGLKWIFNELGQRRRRAREASSALQWVSELSCRQRTCFNRIRRKLHLNAAACRKASASLGGQPFVTLLKVV